jgi:DNA polymerase-3 subunit epsilon
MNPHGFRRRPAPVETNRWVVLDVEASGLDAAHDELLAIAAVALRTEGGAPQIDLGDSFEVVLQRSDAPVDKANILLHGIGVGAQRAGVDEVAALTAFAKWVGRAPLIAFHAAFDATLIRRAMRRRLGRVLANPWLDLAPVAAALRPDVPARSLDEWLAAFELRCARRHQAAADTLVTAELLLRLWPALRAQGVAPGFAALQRLAAQRRWLGR